MTQPSDKQKPQVTRADFAHAMRIPTRWIDNDIYGHVNNALYYTYFDTIINHYLVVEGGMELHTGAVIGLAVETGCQFLQPIAFPQVVDARMRVGRLGNSSVRYEVGLFIEGLEDVAAYGFFVHVFVDRVTRRPTPIPDPMRAALARLIVA